MELKNTRFGDITYRQKDILEITGGLVGLPGLSQFLVLDFEVDTPFKWLQSVQESNIGFLIAEPRLFRPDYSVSLDEEDLAACEAESVDDLVIVAICTFREKLELSTGNLRAPIVVNETTRRGQQVILEGCDYTTHESIAAEIEKTPKSLVEETAKEHCG